MRLICPSCDAQYEVADNVIPDTGRDVQCSNCGTTWFQDAKAKAATAALREAVSHDGQGAKWEAETPGATAASAPPPPEDPAPEPPTPRVSADAASILREEAMRELKARLAERPRVETQPDFGMMPPPEEPAAPAEAPAPAPAPAPITSNRDRLPAIDQVDTSRGAAAPAPVPPVSDGGGDEGAARGAFRSGFGISIAAGLAAALVYAYAPQIGAKVPAAQPALQSYVATADGLRIRLDELVRSVSAPDA